MKKLTTRELTFAAAVAALYVSLTLATYEFSFGTMMWQLRIAEALTILPIFSPVAIPGVFVGCIISNLFSPISTLDKIIGPLATGIAAVLTHLLRKKPLAAIAPPVLINAFVVGLALYLADIGPYWLMVGSVGLGQLAACYGLGLPLYYALRKLPENVLPRG